MLTDELQKKLAKRIDGKLLEKDRERKSEQDGFSKNKTHDEVFDKSTTMTVSGLKNAGIVSYVNGAVGSGKESKTFWAVGPSGNDLALKIYLVATSNFKKRQAYLMGDPRFTKIRKGTRHLVEAWAQKEYSNLVQCRDAGMSCAKPVTVVKNVLVMDFIGKNGVPEPLLVETEVGYEDYEAAISIIGDLYNKAKLVHADFSEYNVFKTKKGLVVFDLGSSIDIRHPNALEFLERDIKNITKFFVKRGLTVANPSDVIRRIMK
ncbi:MAG TPA: serine protein kinase RIO [Candidatus Nitrosotalea sp.]|nr:serine protein kinase RIO [Candidatus Nitrosotalea sp.]